MSAQAYEFKAEIQQLLNILVHSLYTERDIFLRELISNASDALSRVQFEILTNRDVLDPDAELKITIECDQDARTLTIRDTGIGMTRDEIVENLGTIAHSGAAEFLKKLQTEQKPADVIGQFGVGFYSVYMAADEVAVTSRSYRPDAQAVRWTSQGDNTYTLDDAEKTDRGTAIVVHLKEDAAEYAQDWKIEQIVKKHSDFVSFPIQVKDRAVNQQTALWRQSPREVTDEQYDNFYKQLTLDFEAPLRHIHFVADVPVDVQPSVHPRQTRARHVQPAQRRRAEVVLAQNPDSRVLQGFAARVFPLRAGRGRFRRPAA
jgi:molecular chaperone HtpG